MFYHLAQLFPALSFPSSLAPFCFTKYIEVMTSPLWRQGVRILMYLDNWAILRADSFISTPTRGPCPHAPEITWSQGEPSQECANAQTANRLSGSVMDTFLNIIRLSDRQLMAI